MKIYGTYKQAREFILSRCEVQENGCWCWIGAVNHKGYGKCRKYLRGVILWTAHRLSCYGFHETCPDRYFVLHTCHNRLCVNPDHLYRGTQQDNINDMFKAGRENKAKGEKHYNAKLNEAQVKEIKDLLRQKIPQAKIAKMFNIGQAQVCRINTGQKWRHLL